MDVQVFVETEKTSLISNPEEWKTKVAELGLTGQQALVEDGKQPNPFLRMDAALIRCFEALCPTKAEIEDFSAEPIPMEALGAYGLALKECYFSKVEIWYNPKSTDPIMVGTVKIKKDETEQFLMARWGKEKATLEELGVKARQAWIKNSQHSLTAQLERAKDKLARIEELADEHFNGGFVYI